MNRFGFSNCSGIWIDLKYNPGTVYGNYTVIGKRFTIKSRSKCVCQCKCGEIRVVFLVGLKSGHSASCGCEARKKTSNRNTIHGMVNTPEYEAWAAMKARCNNPRVVGYHNWGGRGVSVCKAWNESFLSFYRDMGSRPSPEHSLDRIDNSGNYEPGNCRWATRMEQANNTRITLMAEFYGKTRSVTEWSRISQVKVDTIRCRLSRGWSQKEAVWTIPEPRKQCR